MTLQEHYNAAIDYVAQNIDRMEYEAAMTRIGKWRCPLIFASGTINNQISDLMEDYTLDNDLHEDWWFDFGDIEDIFWKIEL